MGGGTRRRRRERRAAAAAAPPAFPLALAVAALCVLAPGPARAALAGEAPTLGTPPVLKQLVPPEVPRGTAFPAAEVTVVLGIDVSATGEVEAVRVERGAGEPFDSAAVAAARRFEFEPGRLTTGAPVPVTITYELRIREPPRAPPPVRLTGRLLERGTRRPLAGAAVSAQAGEEVLARATTAEDGTFALTAATTPFDLVAVAPDHERLEARVDARPGEEREETFYLLPVPSSSAEAVVRGDRVRREITKQVIPADEIASVAGTQGDPLKAVLNLPGAARTAFGSGQLVLRGSAPGDSAAFVEGLQIPILYHFGGLRSTFAPRFLESVEFIPGNFSADYGRLTGGILNARVRDPARDAVHGEADFNVYDAGVAIEAPLSRSWSVGGAFRRSWIDTILPLFLSSDSAVSFSTLPRFYDYQFLATWAPDDRDRVRILFFGSQDRLVATLNRPANDPTITGDLYARIAYHELQGSWGHLFSPTLRHDGSLAIGMQDINTQIGPSLFFDLATKRIDARSTWTAGLAQGLELRAGLDLQQIWYDVSADLPRPPTEGQPPTPIGTAPRVSASRKDTLFQPGAFLELRVNPVPELTLLPALRVDWNEAIGRWALDPRFSVRWAATAETALKAALGVYQQPPNAAQTSPEFGNPDLTYVRSVQASAGVERAIRPGVTLEATGFYKKLDRVVVRNEAIAVDPTAPAYENSGTGRIYGLELLLRARLGDRFFGWLAYTFQRSFRTDAPGDPERLFSFDQPHLLTAVATYRPTASWSFGARYRLVSGSPYTPITGAVYDATGDVFVPSYGATNSGRLGTFSALDLRVDHVWIFERWKLSLYLDVQNVTNRKNQEGWQYSYDYRQRQPLTGLPILPILGLKGEW